MSFGKALPVILRHEGGAVDDPADRGGRTMKGITQRTYDAWRDKRGEPDRDVWSINDSEVEAIYLGFWNDANCPVLPEPLDLCHFDARVNHRPTVADRMLQQSLGVKVDAIIGPETLLAAARCNPIPTAMKYCDIREAFYHRLVMLDRTQEKFLKGWLHRLDTNRQIIQQAIAA